MGLGTDIMYGVAAPWSLDLHIEEKYPSRATSLGDYLGRVVLCFLELSRVIGVQSGGRFRFDYVLGWSIS